MKTHRLMFVSMLMVLSIATQAQDNAPPAPAAEPAQTEMQKWIATTDAQWQTVFKRDVTDVHETELGKLKQQYVASLEAAVTKASGAGDLDGSVALRNEQKRFADASLLPGSNPFPAQDDAADAAPVKQLRAAIRPQLTRLEKDDATRLKALHAKYDQVLAQAQTQLTQRQRFDDALLVKAKRDEVTAAWLTPAAAPAAGAQNPAIPVTKVTKPAVPLPPPAIPKTPAPALTAGSSRVIEVAAEIKAKSETKDVAEGAITFDGPPGDGRRGAKGVLLINDPLTGKNGSTWSCNYSRQGTGRGLFIIHPHGRGQMISHILNGGVGISTPDAWTEVGYGGGDIKRVKKARGFDDVFPLKDGEVYQVVSKLDGEGGYELTINGKIMATARVAATSPLSLEMKPDMKFPGSGRGTMEFKGYDLPLRWAAGYAAVLLGPLENGENVCREVRFSPAVVK
jgi:hypothetical protein